MPPEMPEGNLCPHCAKPPAPANPPAPRPQETRKSLTSVLLMAAWHGGLLIVLLVMVMVVFGRLSSYFSEYAVVLPMSTRFALWLFRFFGHFGLLVLPALVGLDFGACFLMNHLGGRRLCRGWSATVVVIGVLGAAWLIVPAVVSVVRLHGQH